MINLQRIIQCAEIETKENSKKNSVSMILAAVVKRIDSVTTENPDMTKEDVVNQIQEDIFEYLHKINKTNISWGIIEYYLERRINSTSEYNIEAAYRDVTEAERKNKLSIKDVKDDELQFRFELDENLRRLTIVLLQVIMEERKVADSFLTPFLEKPEGRKILKMSSRNRRNLLKHYGNSDAAIEKLEKAYKFAKKSEIEILKERAKKVTSESLIRLKEECIQKIVESARILDSIGLLEEYNKLENEVYSKQFYISSKYNYNIEEVRKMLSPEELKKLSFEQLIAMASFWINRVGKIATELSKCAHIVTHSLFDRKMDENDKMVINISEESINAIELKKRVLYKICINVIIGANDVDSKDRSVLSEWVNDDMQRITDYYKDEYKRYFDKILPDARNDLEEDLVETFPYVNTTYNTYRIKDDIVQAIMIGLLNNNLWKTQNFGYIKEDEKDIREKTFVLVGIDVPGMNMPLRLHVNRKMLIDVVKDINNGSTLFPVYKGSEDFGLDKKSFVPTYIYTPVQVEKRKILQREIERQRIGGRTKKRLRHLYHISSGVALPDHLQRPLREEYIDLNGGDSQLTAELDTQKM